ncbi:MAG: TonB-dependent receptor, partial [Bacteroidota bacterium]
MQTVNKLYLILLTLCCLFQPLAAQIPTQTLRGTVLDAETKIPLIGATVAIVGIEEQFANVTDIDGNFRLEVVPVGRHTVAVRYLGYEPAILSNLTVTSGKEMVLNIELQESATTMQEVVVTSDAVDKREALNEMAVVSARSFTVEESQRYAAAFLDPARMAQNYAGVSSSGDDLSNEIVIRGNSPAYVQWRLEGIEIPGPNHFGVKGSSGGGISMLSSSMMANSDFYTGAFPAEIGNALGGAFDLNFRNGNNEKREHAVMLGVIGLEASTEGPLGPNSKGSYLINYRYSTLRLLSQVTNSLDFGDFDPNYQDLSFKINMPTKKAGVFSLFGIAGKSQSAAEAVSDRSAWTEWDDMWNFSESRTYGTTGLSHRYLFGNQKSYLKTVVGLSYDRYEYSESFLDARNDLEEVQDDYEDLTDRSLRFSTTFHHKFNAQHSLRVGGIFSQLNYNFVFDDRPWTYLGNFEFEYDDPERLIDDEGNSYLWQQFAQWKYRPNNDWTLHAGLHFTRFGLNGSTALEPRAAAKYRFNSRQSLTISAGLHSQMEHLINYLVQRPDGNGGFFQPNRDLALTKAAHFVLGYDWLLGSKTRLKVEAYYQHLFDVPVDTSFAAGSILNAQDIYDIIFRSSALTSDGTGQNIGLDLTFERFFDQGYYYLLTGSIFDSSFEGQDGKRYNTRFNTRFNLTALGGKEWTVGKKQQNTFGLNGKVIYNGGNRFHEWDFETQELTNIYGLQADAYFRADMSLNFTFNRPKSAHRLSLEVQNLTNRLN